MHERRIVSRSEWQRTFDEVKLHPKHLGKKAPWVVSARVEGALCTGDEIKMLEGTGKRAKEELWVRKVFTVAELASHFKNGPARCNGF